MIRLKNEIPPTEKTHRGDSQKPEYGEVFLPLLQASNHIFWLHPLVKLC